MQHISKFLVTHIHNISTWRLLYCCFTQCSKVWVFSQHCWVCLCRCSLQAGLWSQCRSRKESEVFGWSWNRIPINKKIRSRIFLSDSDSRSPTELFLHRTPTLGIPVEMAQFLVKLLLKQRILAVHNDFHWLLVATKLLTAKLHSCYVWVGVWSFFFSLWHFGHFFAETCWSLKHFGHLSHSCIKTRHSSVQYPIFSDIMTKITKFFQSFQKHFGLWPKNNLKNRSGVGIFRMVRNVEKVGVSVRHFTFNSATLIARRQCWKTVLPEVNLKLRDTTVEKNPGFLKKTTHLLFFNPKPIFMFLKKKQVLFFIYEKHKNPILNYFYCIMQYHHFQNYAIITCYTYYGVQNWG